MSDHRKCVIVVENVFQGTTYSEDCLFINIITPKIGVWTSLFSCQNTQLQKANLPVFFYIHGGFYEAGSSTYFGLEKNGFLFLPLRSTQYDPYFPKINETQQFFQIQKASGEGRIGRHSGCYDQLSIGTVRWDFSIADIKLTKNSPGFLSLGDSSAPGNLGLWDQTLALRFAREVGK